MKNQKIPELSVESRNALKLIEIESIEDLKTWTDLELRKRLIQKQIPLYTIFEIELRLWNKIKKHPVSPETMLHDAAYLMSSRTRNVLFKHVKNQQLKHIKLSKLKLLPGFGRCSYYAFLRFIKERISN